MYDIRMIIDKFNNEHNIKNVIETVTGVIIKGKSLCCPIHGGDNKNGASINVGKNIFSCWTGDCGKALKPWNFVQAYYNLDGFKEVAEKVNALFNTNIPIYEKRQETEGTGDKKQVKSNFNNVFKVTRYLDECNAALEEVLKIDRHILLNGSTGIGKTFGIDKLLKNNTDDYIFFLVPTRALAEQVAKDYNYSLFYGDMTDLPKDNRYIVATYKKVSAIQRALDKENEYRSLTDELLVTYTVVVDEVHQLMSGRLKLLGSYVCKQLENLVIDADTSILMSANTSNIYNAYKDTGMFSKYIKVEPVEKQYNLDNLYIYRVPSKADQRKTLLLNKVIENLLTHSKILIQEDNKSNLEEYSSLFNGYGIDNIVINADSKKSDEEAKKEYDSIINDSTLKNIVVLCTSVINAGININNESVSSIIIQDKMQFDTQKIEQFMGRVRKSNNTGLIFLNQGEKPEFRGNIESKINYYSKVAEIKAFELNEYYFNKFGLDAPKTKLLNDWNLYKNNLGYVDIADCLYLENGLFKVDHVAIHEKSRLKFERFNYYDDEFVVEMLKGIKTKNIEVVTLASITQVEEPAAQKNEVNLKDVLTKVLEDEEGLKELYHYINTDIKSKDLKNDIIINLYTSFRDNKIYKELIKNLKTINISIKSIGEISPIDIFTRILNTYATKDKAKERRSTIEHIKRVNIYNKHFKLNQSANISGDLMYSIVRESCDCFVGSTHSIATNKSVYKDMLNDYIKFYGCKYEKDVLLDKHGKKINIKKLNEEFNSCIKNIYESTEKMYLKNLR